MDMVAIWNITFGAKNFMKYFLKFMYWLFIDILLVDGDDPPSTNPKSTTTRITQLVLSQN